jgi:hypothetical protein
MARIALSIPLLLPRRSLLTDRPNTLRAVCYNLFARSRDSCSAPFCVLQHTVSR